MLRAEVDRLPGVELRTGTTMLGFTQDADGVTGRVLNPDGETETIRARWLIACDGASSGVRRQLGIKTESLGPDDPWLVVDGILRDSPGIPGDMVMIGHYSRPALWIRLPGDRVRMEFKVLPGDDRDELVTPAAVERVSRGALPVGHFTADRAVIYTFRSRLAEKWRDGNVFLAGDAAHQAPPLFGQGLCAGMRDVANLIWKLRLVLTRARGCIAAGHIRVRAAPARQVLGRGRRDHGRAGADDRPPGRRRPRRAHPRESDVLPADRAAARPGAARRAHATSGLACCRFSPGSPTGAVSTTSPDPASSSRPGRNCVDELPAQLAARLSASEEITVLSDPELTGELLASVRADAVCVRPDRYIMGVADSADALGKLLTQVPSLVPAPAATA